MKLFVAQSTYSDLEEIRKYYDGEGVSHVGMQFLSAIIGRVEGLKDNPDMGRVVPEFGEQRIRELIHSPFRIVYLREPNSIHVIRVWRNERLLKMPGHET